MLWRESNVSAIDCHQYIACSTTVVLALDQGKMGDALGYASEVEGICKLSATSQIDLKALFDTATVPDTQVQSTIDLSLCSSFKLMHSRRAEL